MEHLKPRSELIIDQAYKPNPSDSYLVYFNKSMAFSQSNYQDQLNKLLHINFRKVTPVTFLQNYIWCIYCVGMRINTVNNVFPKLLEATIPAMNALRNNESSINENDLYNRIIAVNSNKAKCSAVLKTLAIINNGIKIFGWETYRDNYLSSIDKLKVLPKINELNVRFLSRNIGILQVVSGKHLQKLANRWGFADTEQLCTAINKYILLTPSVIELILWYSAATFEPNITR